MLYGALFLLSGATLLTATYLLFEQATAIITLPDGLGILFGGSPGRSVSNRVAAGGLSIAPNGRRTKLSMPELAQLQAEIARLRVFEMHELLIRCGIALGLMAVISVALGWLVAGRVLRPVRVISEVARQIGASNLSERLSLDGPDDEFRELAATLDGLLGRLEASFDTQRRFVANASHELRTPLTLDRALLERALRDPEPSHELWRTTCERLLASSQQQDRLVEALLTLALSEGGAARHEDFELSTAIDSVLLSPDLDLGSLGVRIGTKLGPAAVSGDPRLVERLVRNLVDNAIRYNQPSGRVDITAGSRSDHAVLVVSNTGPPIPATDIERLFQPFQRFAPSRSSHADGTGLGLSIVQAIADSHDARINAEPGPRGGLTVEVTFPPAGRACDLGVADHRAEQCPLGSVQPRIGARWSERAGRDTAVGR
jgi:signal transduction histidine kinase